MTKRELEAIWIPRIGEEGTAALRRCRKAAVTAPATAMVLGVGGTYAIQGDSLDTVIAAILFAGAVAALAFYVYCQHRLEVAISAWFGVKIRWGQLPLMSPKRFDAWREKRGLSHSNHQVGTDQARGMSAAR